MNDSYDVSKLFSGQGGDIKLTLENCPSNVPISIEGTPVLPIPEDCEMYSFSIARAKNKYTAIINGVDYTLINGEWCKDE